jgi:hypothetical protein
MLSGTALNSCPFYLSQVIGTISFHDVFYRFPKKKEGAARGTAPDRLQLTNGSRFAAHEEIIFPGNSTLHGFCACEP